MALSPTPPPTPPPAPGAPRWLCSRCGATYQHAIERCIHDDRRVVRDWSGRVIAGRYELRALLGVGGMDSAVWSAWQSTTHREVAVKLMRSTGRNADQRFERGARIVANLDHPNITVIHDVGRTDDGELYLVMECLAGTSLHTVLRQGVMPIDRALHISDQVLRALDHAHRRRIVHRDVKPGNLFLIERDDDVDFVKVLDFGIARQFDDDGDSLAHEVTAARHVCGTPQYMAPEQIQFEAVDARTDVYAFGVVLYRMLTGRLPFLGKDTRRLFQAHLKSAPPPMVDVRPELAALPELEAVVMRALAKAPDDRFSSAAEMRAALRVIRRRLGLLGPDEETTPSVSLLPPSSWEGDSGEQSAQLGPQQGRRTWVVAALLLLLGGGLGLWWSASQRGGGPVAGATGTAVETRGAAALPVPGAAVVDVSDGDADAAAGAAVAAEAAGTPDAATQEVAGSAGKRSAVGVAEPEREPPRPLAGRAAAGQTSTRGRAGPRPAARPPTARQEAAGQPPPAAPAKVVDLPETPEPKVAAPPPTMRMQLLDEDEAREIEGAKKAPRPANGAAKPDPPRRRPDIELLE